MQPGLTQCFSSPCWSIQTLFVGMSQILITSTLLNLSVSSTNIGRYFFILEAFYNQNNLPRRLHIQADLLLGALN